MIGTAAAILGAAVIGGGASLLASKNAASAAESAGNQQAAAAAAAQAEQQRQFDLTRADNAPFRQVGVSAINALGGGFGLSGYGTPPTMTGSRTVASTSVPGAGGISMTNSGGAHDLGERPTSSYSPPPGGYLGGSHPMDGPGPAPPKEGQAADPYAGYLAQNPDLAAEWGRIQSSGGDPRFATEADYLAWHDAHYSNENRPSYADPTTPQTNTPSMTGGTDPAAGGAAPGYTDPTAPNGYSNGPRPASMTIPGQYQAGALDLSSDAFRHAPGYDFGLQEGQKAQDHVASAGGGLMSGARIKAATRYGQDYADTKYNDWRNFTTTEYNADRAFNYGAGQDAITQANLTQARQDGLFADDRSYDASRYDTRNNQLLSLAGFGQAANNSNAAAGTANATNQSSLLMSAAAARGSAGVQAANAYSGAVNNLMTTGAYLGGQYLSGAFNRAPVYGGGGYTGAGTEGGIY